MKLLVLNGPNLNFLGIREPDIYGRQDFAALEDFIRSAAQEFQVEVELFQSNYEGDCSSPIMRARWWKKSNGPTEKWMGSSSIRPPIPIPAWLF